MALLVEVLEQNHGDNLIHLWLQLLLQLLLHICECPVAAAIYSLTASVDAEAAEIK